MRALRPAPAAAAFSELRLKNVRCFRDARIPLGSGITVIIGGNGAGKTTFVESLASMTWGDKEGLEDFPLRRGATSGEVSLWDQGKSNSIAKWTSKGGVRKRLPKERLLLAYGRYRRVFFPGDSDESEYSSGLHALEALQAPRPAGSRTATLSHPDNNLLRDLSKYLLALHAGASFDPKKKLVWDRMNDALNGLGQSIDGVVVRDGPKGDVPMVVRRGAELELRELSDGYQALLVIVFDMLLLYADFYEELDNPLDGNACVAIDEVDLHLHPRWQRTVVQQLKSLFPKTQFVLTTHSPAVVQGAIDLDQTIVVLREQKRGEVVPRKLGRTMVNKMKGAEIGSLLVENGLFGVDSRYSLEIGEKEREVERLRKRVASGASTEEERQKLSQHMGDMHELVEKEDVRRSDSSAVSGLSKLQQAFAEDLARELELAKQQRGSQ